MARLNEPPAAPAAVTAGVQPAGESVDQCEYTSSAYDLEPERRKNAHEIGAEEDETTC